jgi:glucose-6-phosphate dehydrogenase assembly protein OpcA
VADREFQDLFSLAHKIVIDSEKFEDPEVGYSFVENACRLGRNITDLAWTRLTRLRQLVAQLCENEVCNKHICQVKRIEVSHSRSLSPVGARYLGRWLYHALPVAELVIAAKHQTEITLTGPGIAISVMVADNTSAILKVNDFIGTAPLPKLREQELLREELSILGDDPIFKKCFT